MSQKVAIYAGPGTDLSLFPVPGQLLTPADVVNTDWDISCRLFIMPGGRDRPYHKALQGMGNKRIRTFVERGGIYLGICAGAYYGSKQIEFDKDYPLEVCEERDLAFFPGKAIGPAYGKGTFQYFSHYGAKAATLFSTQGTFHAYYNGGCTFEGDFSTCRVLASFADLPQAPPAVIECSVGKGLAILSGVHFEIPSSALDRKDPFLSPLIPILESSEMIRSSFYDNIIYENL